MAEDGEKNCYEYQRVFDDLDCHEEFPFSQGQEIVAAKGEKHHKDAAHGENLKQGDGVVPLVAEKEMEKGSADHSQSEQGGKQDEGGECN